MEFFIKILSLLLISTIPFYSYSQVGINTESPEGILQIKSDPLSTTKGVLIDQDGNDGISVAIDDDIFYPSSSISLGGRNKAFMPNRVKLTDVRGTGAGISNPITNPVDGMMVYNTSMGGSPPNNVIPGLYVFNASKNRWIYLVAQSLGEQGYHSFSLSTALLVPTVASYTNLDGYAPLSLKLNGASTSSDIIEIGTEAAYSMNISLVGTVTAKNIPRLESYSRMGVYIAVVSIADDGTKSILDIAEINPAAYKGTGRYATYPIVLGFGAKKGDKISLIISTYTSSIWTLLPDETSVVLWKI
ncbi:hypothetical protein [Dysgonomonas sp. BGC7]|uniref:hypothetical protein n=1 Tax=Dysgonomonas sp. BGC7 TaxID=1658008 RepID=UPI0006810667|nr:hypothetical protein [Dysgonomonas sp. BGC7]MBD8387909.1 hypothetical protein [Dysgonomonas sp. BGC7]